MEESIRKTVWNGRVPLQITAANADLLPSATPLPLFVLAQRISYLPLLVPSLQSHFESHVVDFRPDRVWFEFNGSPLRMCRSVYHRHWPLGLLFDRHCKQTDVPWQIIVHFTSFPSEKLLRIDNITTHFMNSLKEADYIRFGSAKKVMNLSKADQTCLFDSIANSLLA